MSITGLYPVYYFRRRVRRETELLADKLRVLSMRLRRDQRFRRRPRTDGDETGIDLAPMLDFVLNLLIFFIITAVFVKEIGLTVSRPSAAQRGEEGSRQHRRRRSDPDGDIWIDKRVVDVRAVRANIERLHAQKPDDAVVVVAPRRARTPACSCR